MNTIGTRISRASRAVLGEELHLFLAYATIVFRPGAASPTHPHAASGEPNRVPASWTDEEYQLFIEEARIDVVAQQAEKRDIRARAQALLAIAILVGGAIATSYRSQHDPCARTNLLYGAAVVLTALTTFAAGGVISARSDIGTVSVPALTHYETGELRRAAADGYAATRSIGAETVAVLVTVLRVCVLSLILGAGLLGIAHVWS